MDMVEPLRLLWGMEPYMASYMGRNQGNGYAYNTLKKFSKKSKKVKNQNLRSPHEAEAHEVVREARVAVIPIAAANVPRFVVPTAAADHPIRPAIIRPGLQKEFQHSGRNSGGVRPYSSDSAPCFPRLSYPRAIPLSFSPFF